MRLIDADELKKAFYNQECWNCVIEHIIDNAPTVTPDKIQAIMKDYLIYRCEHERPQGEWIETEYQRNYEGGANLTFKGWQCSNCGFERHRKRGMSKFCENCGAKMKGGTE